MVSKQDGVYVLKPLVNTLKTGNAGNNLKQSIGNKQHIIKRTKSLWHITAIYNARTWPQTNHAFTFHLPKCTALRHGCSLESTVCNVMCWAFIVTILLLLWEYYVNRIWTIAESANMCVSMRAWEKPPEARRHEHIQRRNLTTPRLIHLHQKHPPPPLTSQ